MSPFRSAEQKEGYLVEPQVLVVALWGALSVFVLWVAGAKLTQRRLVRQSTSVTELPEPTPEEILEAQALGIIPVDRPSPNQN